MEREGRGELTSKALPAVAPPLVGSTRCSFIDLRPSDSLKVTYSLSVGSLANEAHRLSSGMVEGRLVVRTATNDSRMAHSPSALSLGSCGFSVRIDRSHLGRAGPGKKSYFTNQGNEHDSYDGYKRDDQGATEEADEGYFLLSGERGAPQDWYGNGCEVDVGPDVGNKVDPDQNGRAGSIANGAGIWVDLPVLVEWLATVGVLVSNQAGHWRCVTYLENVATIRITQVPTMIKAPSMVFVLAP